MIETALALAFTLSSACAGEPMTKDGVLAAERDWVDAIEQGDAARLDCQLAPKFTDSNWQGRTVSRASAIANIAGRRPHLSLDELTVELLGRTAIVHGLNTRSEGAKLGTVRFTDVFVYRAGRWQAVSAQEAPVRK